MNPKQKCNFNQEKINERVTGIYKNDQTVDMPPSPAQNVVERLESAVHIKNVKTKRSEMSCINI